MTDLSEHFERAQCHFFALKGDEESFDLQVAVADTHRAIISRDRAALYSKNEELSDFSTDILKFLYLEYYLAKFYVQCRELEKRLQCLRVAKRGFESYLSRCCELRLLHDEETQHFISLFPKNRIAMKFAEELGLDISKTSGFGDEDIDDEMGEGGVIGTAIAANAPLKMIQATPTVLSLTPEQQRNFKISKFRREKESAERIQYLQFQSRKAKAQSKLGKKSSEPSESDEEDFGEEVDAEADLRELYILQLQSYARDSIDEVLVLEQEMAMLITMEAMKQKQQAASGGSAIPGMATNSPSGRFDDDNDHSRVLRANIASLPSLPPMPARGEGNRGIEVTRTGKGSNGELLMKREMVRANVFVPSMEAPSMTLEEFADIEKAQAIERAKRQAESEALGKGADTANESRRYAQLEADGDEDVTRLVDAATRNDREWDDWKEDNPKGWGNKAGKRF